MFFSLSLIYPNPEQAEDDGFAILIALIFHGALWIPCSH
jgi:hypothetical protein